MYIFMGCWQEISFKISTSIYFLIWFKFYFIVFSYAKKSGRQKGERVRPPMAEAVAEPTMMMMMVLVVDLVEAVDILI